MTNRYESCDSDHSVEQGDVDCRFILVRDSGAGVQFGIDEVLATANHALDFIASTVFSRCQPADPAGRGVTCEAISLVPRLQRGGACATLDEHGAD